MPKKALTQEDQVFHFSFPEGERNVVSQEIKNGLLLAIPDLETMFAGAGLVPKVIEVIPLPPQHPIYVKNRNEFNQHKNRYRKLYAQTYPMPGMHEADIRYVQETGKTPTGYPYTCHHLVPLRWGGQNVIANMIFLKHEIHQAIHKVTDAYDGFLAHQKINNRIFLVFPMPPEWQGSELRIIHQDKALNVNEWERAQTVIEEAPISLTVAGRQERLADFVSGKSLFFNCFFRGDGVRFFIPGKAFFNKTGSYKMTTEDVRPIWDEVPTEAEKRSLLAKVLAVRNTKPEILTEEQWRAVEAGRIPDGFTMVPSIPFVSGLTKEKFYILMEKEGADLLQRMLWYPIWEKIQEFRHTMKAIVIQKQYWPMIVSMQSVRSFIEKNREAAQQALAHARLSKAEERTQIEVIRNQNGVVLQLSEHPFVHQPSKAYVFDAAQIKSFRPDKPAVSAREIEQALCRRDAGRLKNLGREERLRIEKQRRLPASLGLEMRYIVPAEWGGAKTADNVLWMKKEVYATYHRTVLMPLAQFIAKRKITGRISVILPQPMDAYLPPAEAEIVSVKNMAPNARRRLVRHDRRQSKIELRQEWQYE